MSKKNVSLQIKLVLGFILVGMVPALLNAGLGFKNSAEAIKKEEMKKLIAVRESKSSQLEEMFQAIESEVITQAANLTSQTAMKEFSQSFDIYHEELQASGAPVSETSELEVYYDAQFAKEYGSKNKGDSPANFRSWQHQLDASGLALQLQYISRNSNKLGSKHLLDKADSTTWSQAHEKYHPAYRLTVEQRGFYDLFLIDGKSNRVVYSVFKELDFATSLSTGPFAGSGLAKVHHKAMNTTDGSSAVFTDMAPYTPSYEFPAMFVGTAIRLNGENIGTLVIQIPVEKINAILTNNNKWKDAGLGNSGEVYVVGQDKMMRSTSRFLVEDPKGFFNLLTDLKVGQTRLDYMESKGTAAISHEVDTLGVNEAFTRGRGEAVFKDYRGIEVYSAFKTIELGNLKWAILAEIDESEAMTLTWDLFKSGIILILVSVLLIFAIAWGYASRLTKRISNVVTEAKHIANATDMSSKNVEDASNRVSEATQEQASAIQETVATLTEITAIVNRSVENVNRSAAKSENSHAVALEGKEAVTEVMRAIEEINSSNNRIKKQVDDQNLQMTEIVNVINQISEKTKVIDDIVFQTKLLSFNASVEAARAGEHGRGFAVVATEVGSLAEMSGRAAAEIANMLGDSVCKVESIVEDSQNRVQSLVIEGESKVNAGVTTARRCEEVLDQVVGDFGEVKSMMDEINTASQEQAQGIDNIAEAMNQLEQTTQSNSEIAHSTSRFANQLSDQSSSLLAAVGCLETEIFGRKLNSSVSQESISLVCSDGVLDQEGNVLYPDQQNDDDADVIRFDQAG